MNTAQIPKRLRGRLRSAVLGLCLLLAAAGSGWAAFGEDIEKPKPEFTREDDKVTARLVPRGKRTSVEIAFQVEGGTLRSVEGVEFETLKTPNVDSKDFRSALFEVSVAGLAPGGECRVSLSSAYFTGSTELWVVTPGRPPKWVDGRADSVALPEFVQQLTLAVADGGPFDGDGTKNGEIRLVAGPRDSFWGYAMGTLLIRFFGIFIVLGVLQAGMTLSGRVFTALARKAAQPASPPAGTDGAPQADGIDAETAAAIGVALHLHLQGERRPSPARRPAPFGPSAWAQSGRSLTMGARLRTLERSGRK